MCPGAPQCGIFYDRKCPPPNGAIKGQRDAPVGEKSTGATMARPRMRSPGPLAEGREWLERPESTPT